MYICTVSISGLDPDSPGPQPWQSKIVAGNKDNELYSQYRYLGKVSSSHRALQSDNHMDIEIIFILVCSGGLRRRRGREQAAAHHDHGAADGGSEERVQDEPQAGAAREGAAGRRHRPRHEGRPGLVPEQVRPTKILSMRGQWHEIIQNIFPFNFLEKCFFF